MANILGTGSNTNGTFDTDLIVASYLYAISQIRAGNGDDVVVAGLGPVQWDDQAGNATMAGAQWIGDAANWTVGATPVVAGGTTPRTSVLVTGTGAQDWFALTLATGERITIDLDFAAPGFDGVLQLVDQAGNLVAKNDDADSGAGGLGSRSGADPFLTYTATSAGTYYINVARYSMFDGDPAIPAGAGYLLHVSATMHTAGATAQAYGAELYGEDGDDLLIGTAFDDVLVGGAGNDSLVGGAGFDTASYADAAAGVTVSLARSGPQDTGGAGVDTLSGIEHLIGSNYNDVLTGGDGNDALDGGGGSDVINGGAGNDRFTLASAFNASSETYNGGGGRDTLTIANGLGWAIDLVAGTATDTVYGTQSTIRSIEVVRLGASADRVVAATGATISTGDGDDVVVAAREGAQTVDAGSGTDTLDLTAFRAPEGFNLDMTTGRTRIAGISFTGFEHVTGGARGEAIAGTDGVNTLIGNGGNDTLSGRGGMDRLEGGDGNDALDGGADADTLYGGAGNNRISGGNGNDWMTAGIGNDRFDGGTGVDFVSYAGMGGTGGGVYISLRLSGAQDTNAAGMDSFTGVENLIGTSYADSLEGDDNANVLNGGTNIRQNEYSYYRDHLNGHGGNDTLIAGAGDDYLTGGTGNDILNGGAGYDVARYEDATGGITVSLAITGPQDVGGGQGTDTLIGIESIYATDFTDHLTGNEESNAFDSGDGNDVLIGAGGSDAFHLGDTTGRKTVDGGASTDLLYLVGSSVAWTFDMDAGRATSATGGRTIAMTSIEFIQGGNLGDTMITGLGTQFAGADGDDTLVASAPVIFQGGAGTDTLDLRGWTAGDAITLWMGDPYQASLSALEVEVVLTGDTTDVIIADNFANHIATGGGADYVQGGGGADRLEGGGGADELRGDGANDRIDGGAGNDRISGGAGTDRLTGGAGADRFLFASGEMGTNLQRADTITDFSRADGDRIDLSLVDPDATRSDDDVDGFTFIGRAAFSGAVGELRYDYGGDQTLIAADTDGDARGDLFLRLDGRIALAARDFVLRYAVPAMPQADDASAWPAPDAADLYVQHPLANGVHLV